MFSVEGFSFSLKDLIVAQIEQDLTEALLRVRMADGQIDGSDAEQDGQQQRLLELGLQVLARVIQLLFHVEAECAAVGGQRVPVSVQHVASVAPSDVTGHWRDEQQGQVVGRTAVGDHLPVDDGTIDGLVVAPLAEEKIVTPEIGVRQRGDATARSQQVGDGVARFGPQFVQFGQHVVQLLVLWRVQERRQLRQSAFQQLLVRFRRCFRPEEERESFRQADPCENYFFF